jgi:WD40 repeat protein
LYKTPGAITDVRLSPDGKRVLFMDHESFNDDRGWVRIADGTTITTVAGDFSTETGVAWTPDGRQVLFSGGLQDQINKVWIADAPPAGGQPPAKRILLPVPGAMVVFDVAADGTLLTATDPRRYLVGAMLKGMTREQDFSWLDMSWSPSLSADGSLLLFTDGHGGNGYSTVIRRIGDGTSSSISRLGPGASLSLSPDGRHALAVDLSSVPQKLVVYPTGPGSPVTIPPGAVEKYELDEPAPWFPDSKTFLILGSEPGKRSRMYRVSMDGGPPVPFLGDSVRVALVAPDGERVVGIENDKTWRLYSVDGKVFSNARGLFPTDVPVGWTSDDLALIVATLTTPTHIDRVELSTGLRKQIREVQPPGLESRRILIRTASADGEQYAYSGTTRERTIYVVKGVPGISTR